MRSIRRRRPQPELLRHGVTARIREMIWGGTYAPGTHLTETELAERLGFSRGPIREAIQELVRQGLVITIPNRGAFVVKWSVEDVSEVFDVRSVLEGLAAKVALQRLTPERLLPPFERIVEAMGRVGHSDQLMSLVDLEMGFHRTLARSSGNRRLIRMHDDLAAQTKMLIAVSAEARVRLHEDFAAIADLHRPILEAFRSGDADAARREAEEHVRSAGRRLIQRMLAGSLR